MPGIRIQHPTRHSTRWTISDSARPYPRPWHCPAPPDGCGGTHLFKTYHFQLDITGAAIVSPEIWERLQRIPGQPFVYANEVKAPPAQVVRVPLALGRLAAISPGVHE